jgi:propionyl-CoA carboxylase alpha chain
MGAQAVALAKAVNYDSAGTVEFVAGQDKSFYFLEMNTRLQVEHPVTELITGLDLVEQMIRVAAGERLSFGQGDLSIKGWAVESRIYAEDPYRNFLPSIGRLVGYSPPTEGPRGDDLIRNDAGVREGDEISVHYDPMIAKLCTHASTRIGAIDAMGQALDSFLIEGVGHNIPFLSAVMDQERFRSGALSTRYIADEFEGGFQGGIPTGAQLDIMTAAAAWMQRLLTARARRNKARQTSLGASGGAESFTSPVRSDWVVVIGDSRRSVHLNDLGDALGLDLLDEDRSLRLTAVDWRPGNALFSGVLDGAPFTVEARPAPEGFVIRHRAAKARVLVLTPLSAELHDRLPKRAPPDTSRLIASPMPGLVVSLDVVTGQAVKAGETVAVIEAMKMQNIIRAERDGVVKTVGPKAGDTVVADEVLVEFA